MYLDYRRQTTENIAKFIKTGESFRVTGKSGVGKSKYLRHLSNNDQVYKKYFKPLGVKLYYLDLNRYTKATKKDLTAEICRITNINPSLVSLKSYLTQLKNKNQRIYICIDHFENIQEYEKGTVTFLRALRDEFKSCLSFILAYDLNKDLDKQRLYKLFEISAVEIEIGNLDKKETKKNIRYTADQYDVEISDEEVSKMVEVSGGYPRYIKQLLSHKLAGVDIDKAIINIQNLNMGIDKNDDYFLDTAIKNMTKAEFMFFEELYYKKDKVIVRDRFAYLLSPTSEGEGVSNEAIDQVISRLRKKLEELKFPFHIKTQRGIGYYME